MQTGRPIPLLLLLLLLVVAGVVVVARRRASARKDEQRAEAAGLRGEADDLAVIVADEDASAQQARERAEAALAEAERHTREAARAEADAAEQRAAAEVTRREYEATMRRADEVDPDVEQPPQPPVPEQLPPSSPPDAGGPGLVDGAGRGNEEHDQADASRRIAAATDFADEVPAPVYPAEAAGTPAAMSREHVPDAHVDEDLDARDQVGEGADDHASTADAGFEERVPDEHAPAETGAAVAEPHAGRRGTSAADLAAEPAEERFDPDSSRDWAADEPELLEEAHQRGDRLAEERRELEDEARAGGSAATPGPGDHPGSGEHPASGERAASDEAAAGRRISGFHELRDGGFGVGSAAPIEDRAQPLDHPVQAFRDTMTFRAPGDTLYDAAEPDLWFYDEGAAVRSGFRRQGG